MRRLEALIHAAARTAKRRPAMAMIAASPQPICRSLAPDLLRPRIPDDPDQEQDADTGRRDGEDRTALSGGTGNDNEYSS